MSEGTLSPSGVPVPPGLLEAWACRDTDEARSRALAQEHAAGPHLTEAEVVLAYHAWRAGELTQAAELATRSLRPLQERTPNVWAGHALNILGCINAELSRPAEALKLFDRQLQLARTLDNTSLEAAALHDMGFTHLHTHPQNARFYLQRALPLFERQGDRFGVALCHLNLGVICGEAAQFGQAAEHFERSLTYFRAHPNPQMEVRARSSLIMALHDLGDSERVRAELGELDALLERCGGSAAALAIRLYAARIHVHVERDRPAATVRLLAPLIGEVERLGTHEMLADLHEQISHAYEDLGDPAQALSHLRRALVAERQGYAAQHEDQFRTLDVLHRVHILQDMADQERLRNARLEAHVRELQTLNTQVQRLSRTDSLTGLFNRHWLFQEGQRLSHLAAPAAPLAIAIIDVDHFKATNDTYGHLAGDAVLQTVANLIRAVAHPSDLLARYGGDEFVILRPGARGEALAETCRELQRRVQLHPWESLTPGQNCTLSMGVSESCGEPFDAALHRADLALYDVKQLGRDAVLVWTDASSEPDSADESGSSAKICRSDPS